MDAATLQGPFQYFLGNSQWLDLQGRMPDEYEDDVVSAVRTLQARAVTIVDRMGAQPSLSLASSGTDTSATSLRRPRPGLHRIADELRDTLTTFVAVALKREKALAGFDLGSPRTLFFAFRFLVYMSLISASLHIPAWSAQGIASAIPRSCRP